MGGKKSMGLFQALTDKKSMNALAQGAPAGSFKDFLRQRGEYPFREEEDITVGIRARKVLGMRLETLLAVALAFGITNVVSFTLGAWNGGDGASAGSARAKQALTALPLEIPDRPGPQADKAPTRANSFVIPPRDEPRPRRVQRAAPTESASAPAPAPVRPVEQANYTIRVITLPGSHMETARGMEKYFKKNGFSSVRVRNTAGGKIVIEVGAFASCRSSRAKESLRKVQSMHFKYDSFRTAYMVRR